MGMRIHGGGGGGYSAGPQDAQWKQRRQNFDALAQAISTGNLSNANDAFAKIQAFQPAGGSAKPNSFLDQIGAALKSDDMTTAQQLLAARINRNGDHAPGVDPTQQTAAVIAANGAAPSATGASYGSPGHHHHHHGSGGTSPAMDLSQAIQSGDTAKAKSSMQTLLNDLQQVADMSNLATSGTSSTPANPMVSSAASSATTLLQNADFKALEDAVANGDAASMKTAWSKLISGATTAA